MADTGCSSSVDRRSGFSLVELAIVVAVLAVVMTAMAAYSIPTIGRERLRSAVYDLQSFVQLTRIEAIKRNRDCRLVVDGTARRLQVWDGSGTTATTDDVLLHEQVLPSSIFFSDPGSGAAISLQALGSDRFQTVFNSNGTVASGAGSVSIAGGDDYRRLSVLGAGGILIERWNGSSWDHG